MSLEDASYAQDSRVRSRDRNRNIVEDFDKLTITYVGIDFRGDEDGGGQDLTIPAKVCVCLTCNGRGKHVNPSIDAHGLSREDFEEDPDFAEQYMSGVYDVTCYGCGGRNVVLEPDELRADPDDLKTLYGHQKEMAEMRSAYLAELRMGA